MIYGEGYALYTGNNKTHLNYTQTTRPECTNYVAHTLIQGTTHTGLYCTVYYSTHRPGPAPKMELCLIDWRGVWSQPYHTLTYLPSLLSQKNLLNIPKRQFLNVMSYLCQIQVTKLHSWEWWTVQRFQSNLFRQNPSITKSSLRIQLSRCAECKKGDSCACWAFWSGPSAKKAAFMNLFSTWNMDKIESRLWKVHDNLAVVWWAHPLLSRSS